MSPPAAIGRAFLALRSPNLPSVVERHAAHLGAPAFRRAGRCRRVFEGGVEAEGAGRLGFVSVRARALGACQGADRIPLLDQQRFLAPQRRIEVPAMRLAELGEVVFADAIEDPAVREEYYRELEKNGISSKLPPLEQSG